MLFSIELKTFNVECIIERMIKLCRILVFIIYLFIYLFAYLPLSPFLALCICSFIKKSQSDISFSTWVN